MIGALKMSRADARKISACRLETHPLKIFRAVRQDVALWRYPKGGLSGLFRVCGIWLSVTVSCANEP